jgi:hypothetical protein
MAYQHSLPLSRRPVTLLPFVDVQARVIIRDRRDLGVRTVPLNHIIGSEGRTTDFDRFFHPRSDKLRTRWLKIGRARYQHQDLPLIRLHKLGDIYFVRDGHHRLSVARQFGQLEIDAHVVELTTDVPLTPDLDVSHLLRKEAQSTFLAWSGLLRVRPDAVIPTQAMEPGNYDTLRRHIDTHRDSLQIKRGMEVGHVEVVADWYDTVYLPQVEAIRRSGIAEAYAGCSVTQLYLWVMEHRHARAEQIGHDAGPEAAVFDYIGRFGSRRARQKVEQSMVLRPERKVPPLENPSTDTARRCTSAEQPWLVQLLSARPLWRSPFRRLRVARTNPPLP